MTERDPTASGQAPNSGSPTAARAGEARFEALKSGLVMRHYVIEEVIGAGGFGITYRAHHERLTSKIFAIKEYFPREFAARTGTHVVSTVTGEELFRWGLERFLREAETLARCHHPGIVDVVDYFEENGTAYAVLGYLEGQHFGQWLDGLGRPPTQEELDRLLMPLLDALEVVHEARLIHRDIAPDNIMIRRDGSPCLIDFGASREDVRDLSRKVSAIVKPGYSPPEQYHGVAERQGPWTDIYAVGATIYRAISGQPPMDSSRRGTLGDGVKPVAEMTSETYRPAFLYAIDAALRLVPEERPQSVAEWRKMLQTKDAVPASPAPTPVPVSAEVATVAASAAPSPPTGASRQAAGAPPSPHPGGRARLPLLIAGVLVLALGGIGMASLLRGPDGDTATGGNVAGTSSPANPSSSPTNPVPASPSVANPVAVTAPPKGGIAAPSPANQQQAGNQTQPSPPIPDSTEQQAREQAAREAAAREAAARQQAAREQAAREEAARAREAREQAARQEAERQRVAAAEQAARAAWAPLAASTDREAIEAYLARHGSTVFAETARARLSALSLGADTAIRDRDALFESCEAAAEVDREARCTPVIEGDDTPERRATALRLRGVARRNAGRLDQAIGDLGQAIRLTPADASLLNDRGIAHFLKGDRAAAISDYSEAIRLDPRHAEALNNRAWARHQSGDRTDALADADRSIALDPTKAYAFDTRGHIKEALGRRDEAIRDFERALLLDPGQADSRVALERLRGTR